jgi:predicted CopG family antitoxin
MLKTINIRQDTKKKLDELKRYPYESYDEIISKIIAYTKMYFEKNGKEKTIKI